MKTKLSPETVSRSSEQAAKFEATAQAIHDYHKSDAFTQDLCKAFAAASDQAREENERLGIVVPARPVESTG